jgi:LytS/YehU family sensor histidine kinase
LTLGEYLTSDKMGKMHITQGGGFLWFDDGDVPMWLASATTFLLTYGFALALVMGFAFYQRLRDAQLRSNALERALSAAHLAALRMQLSPHTLFNLLHTIRGQISWDPAAAQAMVVQLGDLLRRLLTAGERDFSRLEDELQFVRLYLGLQQKRFADRLSVRVPEPDGIVAAWVPSLILQPLVENAVVHGLAGHEGPVSVRVEAVVNEEMLSLRVVNTIAPGKVPGQLGIGLRNVRERLAIQFGERASFSAMPGYDNVWIAEVRLPLLRDGPVVVPKAADQTRGRDATGSRAVRAGASA